MFLRKIIQAANVVKNRSIQTHLLQRSQFLLPEVSAFAKNYSKYIEDDGDDDYPVNPRRNFRDNSKYGFKKDNSNYGFRKDYSRSNYDYKQKFSQGARFTPRNQRSNQQDFTSNPLKSRSWDGIELVEFKKNFYEPHPNTVNRSKEEVAEFRQKYGITVTRDVPNPILSMDELNMPDYATNGLKRKNFTELTPIQAQGWPIVLSGKNLVGVAQTGSGKTLGYVLPALIHIKNQPPLKAREGPIALVLAPTRELAIQIQTVAKEFGEPAGIRSVCVYGGESKIIQSNNLRNGCDLLIATPGRLIDFLNMEAINLERCTYLVLDEADRMLDMGFEPQMRQIISQIRPDRQTLMWSATWPKEVRNLAADYLNEYSQLNVGSLDLCANHNVKQIIKICNEDNKRDHLNEILDEIWQEPEENRKTLIFTQRKFTADFLARSIQKRGIDCESIHSDKSQMQRQRILDNFRRGRTDILVATDVAARGLDVTGIKYVINYDYPNTSADYIHRIGRTGRSNETGTAYTLFTEENYNQAADLVEIMKEAKQKIDPDLIGMSKSGRYRNNRY